MHNIISKLKKDTNNIEDIIYRPMKINNENITIIFSESLTASDKISDFIIRSLNKINSKNIKEDIINNIDSFKCIEINTYKDLCFYLNFGYTIILIEKNNEMLALETKVDLSRSINIPDSENTLRGPKDSFVEDIQKNIGLIKKRIKHNDFRMESMFIGKYTNTKISLLSIKGICKKELVEKIKQRINSIDIDGIISSEQLKSLIENNEFPLPTIITTERPDIVTNALLQGKVAIVVDNSPYVLIIPGLFYDYFKTSEDFYTKSINTTFIRIVRYLAFFIALLAPAIYLSLITYNQEIIPTELLVNFSVQRDSVPFPAFFEAFIMMISFEILRESDIRVPSSAGSALSIVGALILGDAAVNAGIVSPIMIIVIAITAISSLPFNEIEIINGLRWWRILFMIGASFLGLIGIVIVFLIFLIKLISIEPFDVPYLVPYTPFSKNAIKDSFFQVNIKNDTKRNEYLTNNITKERNDFNEN